VCRLAYVGPILDVGQDDADSGEDGSQATKEDGKYLFSHDVVMKTLRCEEDVELEHTDIFITKLFPALLCGTYVMLKQHVHNLEQ
jgi:hypothetical protein